MAKEPKKLNLKSKIDEIKNEEVISKEENTMTSENIRIKKEPKKLNLKSKIENVATEVINNNEDNSEAIKDLISVTEAYVNTKEEMLNKAISEDMIVFPSEEEVIEDIEEEQPIEPEVIVETAEEEIIESICINKVSIEETGSDSEVENKEDNNDSIVEDETKDFEIIKDETVIEASNIEDEDDKEEEDDDDEVAEESIIALTPVVENEAILEDDEDEDEVSAEEISLTIESEVKSEVLEPVEIKNEIKKPAVAPVTNDDIEIEIASNLNSGLSKSDEEDNLLDKMVQFTHGLTDDKIKTMPFRDILTELLKDSNVTDVNFNGKDVFIQNNEKGRYLFSHAVPAETVENFVKDVCNSLNEDFNTESPIIDCEIKDAYSPEFNKVLRLNAVHSSISPYGTTMSIRITQPKLRLSSEDRKFAPQEVFKLLEAMIRGNLNMLISGRTGSGKTELQKFLIKNIRDVETIVLIEDTKDTNLKELYKEKNITSWITNDRIKNPIDFDALIKASLRNNPDWIIISETRSSEAYSMIKSGLSGHKIITTLHSDSAETNVDRLIHMCKEKYDLDQLLLGQMITSVFDVGVHIDYDVTSEGIVRYLCEIVEYKGYNESGVEVNKIFEVALQPVKGEDGKFTYQKVYKYGKLSPELFSKLAKKKVLTPEISRFIKEEYYGKEI